MCNSLAQSSLGPWFDPECGDISFCLFVHFFFFLFTKSFWLDDAVSSQGGPMASPCT